MEWSWKSHEFSVMVKSGPAIGPPLIANWVRGLDYGDAAPSVPVIGAGGVPIDRTDPSYEPGTGSWTVLSRPYRQWLSLVTGGGLVRLAEVDFAFVIKSGAGIIPNIQVPNVDVVEFHITEMQDSKAQGSADPNETIVSIQCMGIVRNGVRL